MHLTKLFFLFFFEDHDENSLVESSGDEKYCQKINCQEKNCQKENCQVENAQDSLRDRADRERHLELTPTPSLALSSPSGGTWGPQTPGGDTDKFCGLPPALLAANPGLANATSGKFRGRYSPI